MCLLSYKLADNKLVEVGQQFLIMLVHMKSPLRPMPFGLLLAA
ncbi:hypothetical protein QWZ13_00015 [Reinekea marina]|nr:hypothetical protein [Reinekea marina]MDN3647287.1 hypothetical protein [Reinekea marina]